jgi:hypothetical protein
VIVDLARIGATLTHRRLQLFQASPALAGFMDSEDKRILVRAANRVGKTKHAAAKLATAMLATGHKRYRAVAVNYTQSIAVVGQYLKDFLPAAALAPGSRFTLENGWSHQLIVLNNGTTCEIRSQDQAPIAHAGSDLDGVWLDEIPPSDILQENIFRVMARQGWLWLTATPIGRPVEYLRTVAEAEDSAWTQYVAPLSHANCPWYGVEQVDEWLTEARAFPDSYEQRINGAWEGTTQSRTFTGFDSSCLIGEDDPQPKGCKIGVGLDHGEHAGSQVAVLVAWNASGIWVLDEAVSKTATTPAQDAVAIREMLLANGLDVHMVDVWIGDVNSVGKLGAGYKVNEILGLALAREAGHARQGFKINTPQKGAGSVDIGEKLLNAGFLRRQVRVHPQCVHVIKGLKHSKGLKTDEPLKHALDALRYIVLEPLQQMNTNRAAPRRYQL